MTHILDTIVQHKRVEVASRKKQVPVEALRQLPSLSRSCVSLAERLRSGLTSGIITEFKRRSPSKGPIHEDADVVAVTTGYARYGASGLSVLTDETFFGGATRDLEAARAAVTLPILRKDFIIDPYQVIETKAMGADVLLLIAECLTREEVFALSALARETGLEVLLEMHSADQLDKLAPDVTMVGINNRDLKTFSVDIERSIRLAAQLPADIPRIAESGIDDPQTLVRMCEAGFDGFLMGEHFMKQPEPQEAFREFVELLPPVVTGKGARGEGRRLKVCGLTLTGDMEAAAAAGADYAGMIFYAPSPRYVEGKLSSEAVRGIGGITKVGVFVNATTEEIIATADRYQLDMIQLHGDESPAQCRAIRERYGVIKAFRIATASDLLQVSAYEADCDFFLFDTAGALYGGNGARFDWSILAAYRGRVPFFLSGGIGPEHIGELKAFSHPRFYGIDVNSGFELRAGEKNMDDLKKFIWDLNII